VVLLRCILLDLQALEINTDSWEEIVVNRNTCTWQNVIEKQLNVAERKLHDAAEEKRTRWKEVSDTASRDPYICVHCT